MSHNDKLVGVSAAEDQMIRTRCFGLNAELVEEAIAVPNAFLIHGR